MKVNRNLKIGNLQFNIGRKQEIVDLIESLRQGKSSECIIFWGVPMVVAADKNLKYRYIEQQSALCVADGKPIVAYAKRKGLKNAERCAGPDIMDMILFQGIKKGIKHFFYGTTDEVLEKLRTNLEIKYPGINIVGMYAPSFRELTKKEDEEIVEMINNVSPDYLWVALGAPKQEEWMLAHKKNIKNTCMMGVGAAFNFFAGTVKRSPIWMQKAGLEWLYRLFQEPRHLWKRYILAVPKFIRIAYLRK